MIVLDSQKQALSVQEASAPPSRLKSLVGGSIGNLVEWFDWFSYTSFSLFFAKSFFPAGDQTAQLLSAAAVFAVGFLIRPAGGWLLGFYADRRGRRTALTLSVVLMCLGSLMIALAPTYRSIGLASPVILVLARLIQGLSVGGEYGASATYLSEIAPPAQRGFYASFQYVTMILGQLLALGLLLLLERVLSQGQLESWGWRIPFALGALCALSALQMRRGIQETRSFSKRQGTRGGPSLFRLLREHRRSMLTVSGLTLGGTVAYYTYSTYMQKYLVNSAGWSAHRATLLSAGVICVFMLIQPLAGALSDRIGRRPLMIAFGILGTLLTIPLLTSLGKAQNPWWVFTLSLSSLVIVTGYTSTSAVVKAELFPAEVRALGIGLPHALTVSLFGGTAEVIALAFKKAGHELWYSGYVTAAIALTLLVSLTMPHRGPQTPLDRDCTHEK
jgi:MHS family alpha-ketoglutarate permease-like MFS transporter